MKIQINLLGAPHEVDVERKKMRSIRLRVADNGDIRLSAPRTTPQRQLELFLDDHRPWLEQALVRLERKVPPMGAERLADGAEIRLRGAAYRLSVGYAPKIQITADHAARTLSICGPKSDEDYLRARFEEWWRAECLALYTALCARYLPLFERYRVRMPQLTVRKMTSRWGSCSASTGRISLNFYLMRAPMACIEYVVLHELTHMINQSHNRTFYDFIARRMPDWQARRELLKNERIS